MYLSINCDKLNKHIKTFHKHIITNNKQVQIVRQKTTQRSTFQEYNKIYQIKMKTNDKLSQHTKIVNNVCLITNNCKTLYYGMDKCFR